MDIKNTDIKKYFPATIFVTCFTVLFYDTIMKMVHDWSTNDNYSHGFLVPFIALYLIWKDRQILSETKHEPNNYGLIIFIGCLLFYVVTNIGAELFTMRLSMIGVIIGSIVFLFGMPVSRIVFLPVMYLCFMVPFPAIIWNMIAFPLKLFATKIAVIVIDLMHIPVYQEGNIIHLSNTTLEVVDACSGLRSLMSLLALSAAYALISDHIRMKKIILFLSAVPIAIVLNILRLSLTAVLARFYGPQIAQGFLHDMSGIFIFLIAMVLLAYLNRLMGGGSDTETKPT